MPQSILLVAGPTNLFEVRRLGRPLGGGALAELSKFIPMDPSAEFIKSAMFPTPQTSIPQTPGLEGFMQPRSLLGLSVFLKSVLPEFIVLGLVDGKLPEKGTAKEEDLKYISTPPLLLLQTLPPRSLRSCPLLTLLSRCFLRRRDKLAPDVPDDRRQRRGLGSVAADFAPRQASQYRHPIRCAGCPRVVAWLRRSGSHWRQDSPAVYPASLRICHPLRNGHRGGEEVLRDIDCGSHEGHVLSCSELE